MDGRLDSGTVGLGGGDGGPGQRPKPAVTVIERGGLHYKKLKAAGRRR